MGTRAKLLTIIRLLGFYRQIVGAEGNHAVIESRALAVFTNAWVMGQHTRP